MFSQENRSSPVVVNEEFLEDFEPSTVNVLFLNRKPLEVNYYIEDSGTEEPLIMMDTESLLPIFGGRRPTVLDDYESLDSLCDFVDKNVNYDECSNYEYADCICNLMGKREVPTGTKVNVLPPSDCWYRHFHHACRTCVKSWLLEYLRMLILHRECQPAYEMAAEEICSRVFITDNYKEFLVQDYSEFYLWISQRWSLQGYLRHDIVKAWQ